MTPKEEMSRKLKYPVKGQLYTKGSKAIASYALPDVCHINNRVSHRSIASDINLRGGYNRYDKDIKRPDDKLPTEHAAIIQSCQGVYRKIGMVRNIIDLMTDFASEGLELQHPIKIQERFYREWARRVNLQGRAHDFMKLLMRDANVIVRRKNAKITRPVIKEMSRGMVSGLDLLDETFVTDPPEKVTVKKTKTPSHEIPWKYTFLSPVVIEKIGGQVGRFFGSDDLGFRIPITLANAIKNPKTDAERDFIKKLPPEVVRGAKKSGTLVKLNMNKIYVDYYKKDDWEDWGTPFLYGVLEDIMFKEKMRLADMAALDGVINVIRIWKLGKSEQQILPTPAAVDKLIDILQNNVGGGVMDLVWDDMINLEVEYPPTDKILGKEKYVSVNGDIVRGLGIPDSLIGGSDLGTRNAQSAFVQLKTLVERLEYVRSRAIKWMQGELKIVADAMGFRKIPAISFGTMSLRDEAAEKQLIIQLLDRGIISAEKASEVFGTNFMIELERLKSEQQIRENNPAILEKSNPYNRPFSVMEKQTDLAVQLQKVKMGLDRSSSLPTTKDNNGGGDNPIGDQPSDDGVNSPGRPPSTVDTNPRDSRTPIIQSMLHIVADGFMDQIDEILDNAYLKLNNIKNVRSLTKAQRTELEITKRGILSVLRPGDTVTKELIVSRLNIPGNNARKLENVYNSIISEFTTSTKGSPTIKERKMLTALAWAICVSKKDK